MPDWKDAAAARGVELDDARASRMAAIDQAMTLMSAMIDWKEEPIQTFRVDEIDLPASDAGDAA